MKGLLKEAYEDLQGLQIIATRRNIEIVLTVLCTIQQAYNAWPEEGETDVQTDTE